MTVVGITGAGGMLGWHIGCALRRPGYDVVPTGRELFAEESRLDSFVRQCDVIVHAAGVNRASDEVIEATNPRLATQLVEACERENRTPTIIYTNSVQQERDNPYGRSKRRAADTLRSWGEATGASFVDLVLPHVFGEGGRPHHNSAVATFCHQLAVGEPPVIILDSTLELLHAQDVADRVRAAVDSSQTGSFRMRGVPCLVSELLDRLRALSETYGEGLLPAFSDPLDLSLFNTLRYYLYPARYPGALTVRGDDRGSLFEAVKGGGGGQTFLSHTHPGITRGNHFHLRKVERFVVVEGEAVVSIRPILRSEVRSFHVSGSAPHFIDIPTLHTHNITNIGADNLLTLFWANEIFDPVHPDTYAEIVGPERVGAGAAGDGKD